VTEEKEQPTNRPDTEQENQAKVSLTATPEGRLFLVGVTLAFLFTFWLGINLLLTPEDSQIYIGMTATQVMFGRAASMAFGYSLGLGHSTVMPICMIIETILVFIFYPLFVFSWRHLVVLKWLKNTIERIQKAAEAHKGKIQKYGIIGLFVFVWFPFWMTGPVVGCVIGFMLGLRIRLNIPVVLAGTYAAIVGWAFFLKHFHDRVSSYNSYAAMILMILLVIIIIVGHLLYRTLHEHKNKN